MQNIKELHTNHCHEITRTIPFSRNKTHNHQLQNIVMFYFQTQMHSDRFLASLYTIHKQCKDESHQNMPASCFSPKSKNHLFSIICWGKIWPKLFCLIFTYKMFDIVSKLKKIKVNINKSKLENIIQVTAHLIMFYVYFGMMNDFLFVLCNYSVFH